MNGVSEFNVFAVCGRSKGKTQTFPVRYRPPNSPTEEGVFGLPPHSKLNDRRTTAWLPASDFIAKLAVRLVFAAQDFERHPSEQSAQRRDVAAGQLQRAVAVIFNPKTELPSEDQLRAQVRCRERDETRRPAIITAASEQIAQARTAAPLGKAPSRSTLFANGSPLAVSDGPALPSSVPSRSSAPQALPPLAG